MVYLGPRWRGAFRHILREWPQRRDLAAAADAHSVVAHGVNAV
jgi:hypothetical protein